MKVLIDSNILISAALNSRGVPYQAFLKAVSYPNKGIISVQNLEEVKRVFTRKFPQKINLLEKFLLLALQVVEVVPVPEVISCDEELIRDIADRPILRAAIQAKVHVILTGDKDFLEANIKHPLIVTAVDFMNMQQ